jgi:hypothetical protein
MKVRIVKIEPTIARGTKVTVEIKGATVILCDPEDKAENWMLHKEVEAKIYGLQGDAKSARAPAQFDKKMLTAKVLDKGYDYAVLDCGLFTFDYMMNTGEEEEFVVGEHVCIQSPRLDIMFSKA